MIRMLVAVPLLLAIGIAAPASTRESPPIESEEVEEEGQAQHPLDPEVFNWNVKMGEPPPYLDLTPGLTNTEATKVKLMGAVRNIHVLRAEQNLNYAETFRELARELRGELPPQLEEKGIHEANEGLPEQFDSKTGRGRGKPV